MRTDREIIDSWEKCNTRSRVKACERGEMCLVVQCGKSDAVLLTKAICDNIYNDPDATDYDGKTLSFYYGDCGHNYREVKALVLKLIVEYFKMRKLIIVDGVIISSRSAATIMKIMGWA